MQRFINFKGKVNRVPLSTKLDLDFEFTKDLIKHPDGQALKANISKIIEDVKKGSLINKSIVIQCTSSFRSGILSLNLKTEEALPTTFIVQLDRKLKENLGKAYKIGIKKYEVLNYSIEFEVDQPPASEFKVPFVEKLGIIGNKVSIHYKHLDSDFIENHNVERTLTLVKDKIKAQGYKGKQEFKEYIWEGKERKVVYTNDPAIDLEKSRWIKRTSGKGQFVYGREFVALTNTFKELFIKHIYKPLGFSEMIFPKVEPWDVPKKSGHAENVYPSAYFVMVPKESSEKFWEEVIDNYKVTHEIQKDLIKEKTESLGILSFAQCPPFWLYLEKSVIEEKTLPLLVYDWSGPTYRNESGGTHGLDRLEEFHRIETLFVGTKEQVIKTWKALIPRLIKFFDEVLDLEIKAAKVTPWWMAHAGLRQEKGTEEVGTIDFDAYLPYRGDRTKEWLEIQNNSSNGDKYPKAFRVSGRKDELWSGCAGGSLERWTVAFLSQKGLDPKKWPKEVRELYNKKVKSIKPLVFY